MSLSTDTAGAGFSSEAVAAEERQRYFVSPLIDFLCLGGASLIVLPLLALLLPAESSKPLVAIVMMALANVINHPHFAHSYQIFYRDFRRKAFGEETSRSLRTRYIFAGLVVPALLLFFFALCIGLGDARTLGLGMNLMSFLVGWHYIKQGYGMAIVDSVLKRLFYAEHTKRILLINGYVCWILSWMLANRGAVENDFWGVAYYGLELPDQVVHLAAACAVVTSLFTAFALFESWQRNNARIAVNGVVAYLTTIYLWVVFLTINPLFVLVVPAFHSLQYLLIVWRFQVNVERDAPDAGDHPQRRWLGSLTPTNATTRFTLFLAAGIALGLVCFWVIPFMTSAAVSYDKELFGGTLFFFVCWIFINVHHYFLDNVMWRRENPDTKKYLFS